MKSKPYRVVGSVWICTDPDAKAGIRQAPRPVQRTLVLRRDDHPPGYFRLLPQDWHAPTLPLAEPCPTSTAKRRTHSYSWFGYAHDDELRPPDPR